MKRPPMRRLIALLAVLALAMGAIVLRLSVLQVSQARAYRSYALDQRLHTVTLPASRGRVLDRSDEAMAISLPARDVYVDPRYVTEPWDEAQTISRILGLKVRDLVPQLTADTTFVYVARQVDLETAGRLERLHLAGVGFLPSSRRAYPAGPLAPQVLGFVGVDGVGLAGLELEYQSVLAGKPGERTQELDPSGQPIVGGIDAERLPAPGSDLVVTMDRDFQFQVQAALEEAVKANQAQGGTVIVMDPRTGDIYAMATYPWFDPKEFATAKPATWRNRAVTDVFEPGSVNKVITAAATVQERSLPLDELLLVPWKMRVGDFVIHDAHPHGVEQMTLGDVVAQSSNIGAVEVAERLGAPRLATYLSKFGLGQVTGIGFPGESAGMMLPLYLWSDTSLATMAYGQGIAVTPLQMISVYATIANGGVWVRPRLVRGTVDPQGAFHPAAPSPTRRVVSDATSQMVTRMLAYAVKAGTGTAAQIPGFRVAGKTGTARIPKPTGGYYADRYFASFIGYLPASDPKVVIAAILDRPTTVYGGVAAAPLFQQVARYAIERLGIAPGNAVPPPPHAIPAR
ncbi:MAG: penicillin-binding protein 2 [Actinobacteria bacterium]|nr:MAG: penicillin-binding protein 2 [Actinomycetota bacterium]TMK47695.1 MAG: penicillin-binding protein 2 [Actinomycetota bacterium]